MIVTTIGAALEMLDPENDEDEQYIYLYSEGETIFYIGKSRQPFERLRGHLGQGDDKRSQPFPDLIGRLILDNRPYSLEWTVRVIPLSEIHAALKPPPVSTDIDLIEQELIARFHLCLNRTGNRTPAPLPEKYLKRRIVSIKLIN